MDLPSILSKSLPEAEFGLVPSQRLEVVCCSLSSLSLSFPPHSLPFPVGACLAVGVGRAWEQASREQLLPF